MSAWGRVHGIKDEVNLFCMGLKVLNSDHIPQILMLADPGAAWSEKLGFKNGERTGRYALIIDDLVVKSVEVRQMPVLNGRPMITSYAGRDEVRRVGMHWR